MNKILGIAKVIFTIMVIVFIVVLSSVSAIYYERWESDIKEQDTKVAQFLSNGVIDGMTAPKSSGDSNGTTKVEKVLEPNFTCLLMGRNQNLTDFIMLCQYNPNTREVSLLSIPRDTYVDKSSVDGKINSIYQYKYQDRVVAKVNEITGVDVQHYIIFDTKLLKNIVNELGGVTVNVPINMDYDDPYQNLYIHLKKGTQRLTGAQAEGFVRFRKNNNGTGYPNGDIGRIAAQQQFIKAMISEVLKPENIGKISNLVKIVLDSTKTDITMDIVGQYLDDVVTFKTDRIRIDTLPGVGRYDKGPDGLTRSYYFLDEEKIETVVENFFFKTIAELNKSDETSSISGDSEKANVDAQEVISSSLDLEIPASDKARIEVLNANAKSATLNKLVENLKKNDYDVVKIGNYKTTKTESSRIISYGTGTEDILNDLKDITKIKTVEESAEKATVNYSIIIGSAYNN